MIKNGDDFTAIPENEKSIFMFVWILNQVQNDPGQFSTDFFWPGAIMRAIKLFFGNDNLPAAVTLPEIT